MLAGLARDRLSRARRARHATGSAGRRRGNAAQAQDNPIERRELRTGGAVRGQRPGDQPVAKRQRVPDIRAELRDAQGRLVYSWTITPEAPRLPPRGSIDFNSAKLDVPVNSEKLVLSFSGEAGR